MNDSDSTSAVPGNLDSAARQADTIRTLFGSPRLCIEPVLNGSSVDEVLSNPRIAIVDDEPINIKVVQKHLKLAGYQQFFTTEDSTRAMDLIRTEFPDVVLLDIMMPQVSGLEILAELRQTDEFIDLPVIILTAATDTATKMEALRLGATEFLGKPVDAAELEARLCNVLIAKAHRDRVKSYAWELEIEVAVRSAELAAAHHEVVQCLAKVGEFRDNETGNHVLRVGRYAEIIASRMGLGSEFAERIRQAGALHDIGKVGVPDSILCKRGKLDAAEFEVMKHHCKLGRDAFLMQGDGGHPAASASRSPAEQLVAPVGNSPILRMAASIAYTHHEKWDGTGYPRGLRGEDIPLEGRITAVADVFDAVTSPRPYKPAFSLEKSLAIMKDGSGNHFDPAVVEAFFAELDEIVTVYSQYADLPDDSSADADYPQIPVASIH